jgi:hypothetical protein
MSNHRPIIKDDFPRERHRMALKSHSEKLKPAGGNPGGPI